MQDTVNGPHATELFTLRWFILWYVTFISILKRETESRGCGRLVIPAALITLLTVSMPLALWLYKPLLF